MAAPGQQTVVPEASPSPNRARLLLIRQVSERSRFPVFSHLERMALTLVRPKGKKSVKVIGPGRQTLLKRAGGG